MASLVKPSPECRRRAGRNGGLVFLIPLLKPSEARRRRTRPQGRGKGEADQGKGPGDLCPAERARHGRRAPDLQARAGTAKRSKSRVRARAKDGPCADRLRRGRSEGSPHVKYTCGAQAAPVRPCTRGIGASLHGSPGCPFFRFLIFRARKERRLSYGGGCAGNRRASSERSPPANGLATDGKPRTCKREH